MKPIQSGDVVRVNYAGNTESGNEFARSEEPSDFRVGAGNLFPALEQALIGMQVGEQKEVRISAENAFGPHRSELVRYVERASLPNDLDLEVGNVLLGEHPSGQTIQFVVTGIEGARVQLDANHPLAGENLVFQIEVVDIVSSAAGA